MKKLFALVLAAAMVVSLSACGGTTTSTATNEVASVASAATSAAADAVSQAASAVENVAADYTMPDDFTIAYAASTTNLAPWVTAIANEMQAMCDKNGWTLIAYDGQGDVNTQTDQVASIISDAEADLVVLFPVVSDTGSTYVEDLTNAGIPVITLGCDVSEAGQSMVKCYVGPNQQEMVQYGADYIKENVGTSGLKYVILSGFEGQYDYIVREQAVKDDFADTDFECLDTKFCGASRDDAMEAMTTYLNTYNDLDFVFCLSDEFALGAIQAIDNAGKTGDITVVSMEAFKDGLQAIKDGKMSLTVTMTGKSVVEKLESVIPAVMSGTKVDYEQDSETIPVTKDNVDDITVEY